MNATLGKRGEALPPRPGVPQRLDLRSKEHGKIRDWILERLVYSAQAKKEIEREAGLAFKAICSWVDEQKHPWPAITFDPILYAASMSQMAKFANAVFSQPPLFGYKAPPGGDARRAQLLEVVSEHHVRETRPRQEFLGGFMWQSLIGIQFWHPHWLYSETTKWVWRRVPRKEVVIDPVTQQPATRWVEDGNWKYVRVRAIVHDNAAIKALDFTQCFPDDTQPGIQQGEWFIVRDEISGREARARVREDNWDKRAVGLAIDGQAPAESIENIQGTSKWLEEIGLKPAGGCTLTTDHAKASDKELATIEVLECWRRWKGMIQRIILLNRAWICWYGPSPYGHGMFPFVDSRNFRILQRFWSPGNYRITRYLNRGIQSLSNAKLTEAVIGAMPMIFKPQDVTMFGFRWEPRALVEYDGAPPGWTPTWFEPTGRAGQIAAEELSALRARFDSAFGSSDPGRGSIGDAGRAPATTAKIASENAGQRDQLLIETFADEMMLPCSDQNRWNIQQFQSYAVQGKIAGTGEPVTAWPEDYRDDLDCYSISTPSVSALRELDKRRAQELFQEMKGSPVVDQRALHEFYLSKVAEDEKDKILLPMDQMQQQGMPPMMGPGGPVTPGNVGVMNTGDQRDLQQSAAELAEVYGQ